MGRRAILFIIFLLLVMPLAYADVPRLISVQGRLTDNVGTLITAPTQSGQTLTLMVKTRRFMRGHLLMPVACDRRLTGFVFSHMDGTRLYLFLSIRFAKIARDSS